jgi:hypothetical protein
MGQEDVRVFVSGRRGAFNCYILISKLLIYYTVYGITCIKYGIIINT